MTPAERERLRAQLHQTMPEPEATRWRYEVIMRLLADVDALTAENAKLRDVVNRLQWLPNDTGNGEPSSCPACHNYITAPGHAPGCFLNAALEADARKLEAMGLDAGITLSGVPVSPETPQGLLWEEIKECIINGEYDEALHQHRALVAAAVQQERERNDAIFRWLLGEAEDFPERPEMVKGKPYRWYWWRSDLREKLEAR